MKKVIISKNNMWELVRWRVKGIFLTMGREGDRCCEVI